MFKKIMLLSLYLVCIMFFTMGQTVFAAQTVPKDSDITPQAYNYLASVNCSYNKSGNQYVLMAETMTYQRVERITTTLYLDRRNGSGGWTLVNSWTDNTYNSTYCRVINSVTLSPGTYRVRGLHRAQQGNVIETNTSEKGSFTVY